MPGPDRPAAPPPARPSRPAGRLRRRPPPWLRTSLRLLAEMLVVFVGVYAAFWLDEQRAERQRERRAEQIYGMFYEHTRQMADQLGQTRVEMDSALVGPLTQAMEAGEMPDLPYLYLSGSTFDTGLWEAMLESGGLDALEPSLIRDIDGYFYSTNRLVDEVKEFETLMQAHLLPYVDEDPSFFYDLETRRLRGRHLWYLRHLRDIGSTIEKTAEHADSLAGVLATLLDD